MKWGRSFDDIPLAINAQALSPAEHAFTIFPQHLRVWAHLPLPLGQYQSGPNKPTVTGDHVSLMHKRGLEVGNLHGTVAVIDDDASLRWSVVRRLNAYGFPAIEYASAEAFLNRDPEAAIDCLVLDIDLGGMSGIELQRSLKGAGLNLPVIFITALEDSQLKTEAERAGCIGYLRKPFAGSVLIAAINRALGL